MKYVSLSLNVDEVFLPIVNSARIIWNLPSVQAEIQPFKFPNGVQL